MLKCSNSLEGLSASDSIESATHRMAGVCFCTRIVIHTLRHLKSKQTNGCYEQISSICERRSYMIAARIGTNNLLSFVVGDNSETLSTVLDVWRVHLSCISMQDDQASNGWVLYTVTSFIQILCGIKMCDYFVP